MRQWELIGITDTVDWSPPRREPGPAEDEGHFPAVMWTTDGSLRLRGVSWAASQHLGIHPRFLDGRELLDAFGMEGENLPILEAHAAALTGKTVTFSLQGDRGADVVPRRAHPRRGRAHRGDVLHRHRAGSDDDEPMAAPEPPSRLCELRGGQPREAAGRPEHHFGLRFAEGSAERPQLVAGRWQVHALVQHVVEEAREPFVVGRLRIIEVPHRVRSRRTR